MRLNQIHKITASEFVADRHYSAVMPRLTKYYLGCFVEEEMVGVITFGWGTRPMHTIQALFPELVLKIIMKLVKCVWMMRCPEIVSLSYYPYQSSG